MGIGNPSDHHTRKIRLTLPENATASAHMSSLMSNKPETLPLNSFGPAIEYMVDAAQRSVLFLDVMRQRGNQYREHIAETAPHVLEYEFELIVDGRRLERPVNYALVRIVPPANVKIDRNRRLQGRQRDRRGDEGRPPVLFHWVSPRAGPRPDHRRYWARRGQIPREGHRIAPGCRRQAVRDRQLPGRLGGDDARGTASGAVRPDHRRRFATVLLAGRAWQKSDALQRRAPWRQLAYRVRERSRRRQVRRRLARAEFRKSKSGKYTLDQAIQSLLENRHRGSALSGL